LPLHLPAALCWCLLPAASLGCLMRHADMLHAADLQP
jgi:hypothetical protein